MLSLTPEEADSMRRGKKIDAIYLLRARTGLGLKEAKHYVEQWDGISIDATAQSREQKPCPHCGGTGLVDSRQ